MAHRIRLSAAARRQFRKFPTAMQKRLQPAIDGLAENPRPPGAAKMQGEDPAWRLRMGDYGLLYEIHDRELLVLLIRIAHPREACR